MVKKSNNNVVRLCKKCTKITVTIMVQCTINTMDFKSDNNNNNYRPINRKKHSKNKCSIKNLKAY